MKTTNKNYDIVRQAVIKAVPEILELKFGCEVVDVNAKKHRIMGLAVKTLHTNYDTYITSCSSLSVGQRVTDEIHTGQIEKILGRPIRLADVLLATQRKTGMGDVMINSLGGFGVFEKGKWMDVAMPRYNLSKDSLEDQSEETWAFLADLLSPNK